MSPSSKTSLVTPTATQPTNPNAVPSAGSLTLAEHKAVFVKQRREMAELFGFETRNKYEICDEQKNVIGFAAEQQKGFLGFFLRQFLGHWRSYEIHIFNNLRQEVLIAKHPFRIFFQRLEVQTASGQNLGAIQQRFSILSKRFDVLNARGLTILQVSSPFWRIWTFPFVNAWKQMACVSKKWTGLLAEAFTDKDHFLVEYKEANLKENERCLVLAAAIFIDLKYFEKKASS